MAAVIFTLLPAKLDYPLVLGVLLISAIAGVVTHIPAGLGVLEAVFIALLQHEASRGSLLAGLIAYRAIYFICPLLIALVIDLVKKSDAEGTWQASHFSWRIRTVIWAAVLYLVTLPLWLLFFVPGWIAWTVISIWFLYRIVRGMVAMNRNQAVDR